jgi:hypothetical protein
MALQIKQRPQANPDSIAESGGDIDITFSARDSQKDTFLKARYAIRASSPYTFVAPTDASKPKEFLGEVQPVVFDSQPYMESLALARIPGTPHVMDVSIDVEIQETDAAGKPRKVGGSPVSPKRHLAMVTVE